MELQSKQLRNQVDFQLACMDQIYKLPPTMKQDDWQSLVDSLLEDLVEIEVDDNDLRIDTYRASGPGGQSVNTMDSAVRITHLPTGVVVSMQDEKSQLKNKDKALRVLKSRLFQLEQEKADAEAAALRGSQVGSGDRSEKIRTYNYKENRVTDHRIGLTIHKLDRIVAGELDEISDALIAEERRRQLEDDE